MIRTSLSHPIEIAEVRARPGQGRIGITFCPGKKDPDSLGGAWDRDLLVDLDAIEAWGAVAVVSLIEDHELDLLAVRALGPEVRRRHMEWIHLPIRDVSVPDDAFEAAWRECAEGVRSRLRDGFDVLVHCRGGIGPGSSPASHSSRVFSATAAASLMARRSTAASSSSVGRRCRVTSTSSA